ncbi:hypothetical protein CLPUN_19780 [Clostridium puniceum]|uniref:Uncharacterized protein n=1 Tax=Clostridium puniceum TaxID=29367 RepID=A0A1S8TL90_9CLOT|nr:hypothetical protein [Clostridium puniceum]OOM78369.1 hypothetical protein CLPUN_19780 [Clostridium puniceum]
MYNRQIPPYPMWYQEPMGNTYDPMIEEEDEQDLAMLYPRLYHRVMPLVKYQGDQIELRYGTMYCPTKDELGNITDDIYDMIEKNMNVDEYDDEREEDENDNEHRGYYRNEEEQERQRPRRRRRFLRDLISILLLRDLHRRRRRRRRRRPHYGGDGY